MKKLIKADEVKFVDAAAEFDKEDYAQMILNVKKGTVTVKSAPTKGGDAVVFETIEAEAGNLEVNIAGCDQFITVTGADVVMLADKRDVKKVTSKNFKGHDGKLLNIKTNRI